MDEVKKQMEYVLDGVFYLFGFTENPAAKPSKQDWTKTLPIKLRRI
jgi:hypothetical protein